MSNYKLGTVIQGDNGNVFGCAMETCVVKWRLLDLIAALHNHDIRTAEAVAVDIYREVTVAEMLGRPLPVPEVTCAHKP